MLISKQWKSLFYYKNVLVLTRYNGHYFVTTLIYSVLLGFLGMDRFCLGHTGTAVGKLLTLGGVGIWWIVDIVLLVNGMLTPDDDSNWVPYYWIPGTQIANRRSFFNPVLQSPNPKTLYLSVHKIICLWGIRCWFIKCWNNF